MQNISLVVCVYKEKELLRRLMEHSASCYDDLLVVHDGPDTEGVRSVAEEFNGRFFERPRAYQQESHWPFAWEKAKHDWILRLDADEYPTRELKTWLVKFKTESEPADSISGYTCIWPLWDGVRAVTKRWPNDRIFLFNRQRVRFFGMNEQVPEPDGCYKSLPLILHHQPDRKSYGIANVVFRAQAYRWRRIIAKSLLGKPTDLPCWRWVDEKWPEGWAQLRARPLTTAVRRLIKYPLQERRQMIESNESFRIECCLNSALHHFLLGIQVWWTAHFSNRGAFRS